MSADVIEGGKMGSATACSLTGLNFAAPEGEGGHPDFRASLVSTQRRPPFESSFSQDRNSRQVDKPWGFDPRDQLAIRWRPR